MNRSLSVPSRLRCRVALRLTWAIMATTLLLGFQGTAARGTPRVGANGSQSTAGPELRFIAQDTLVAPDGRFTAFLQVGGIEPGSDLSVDIYPAITTGSQLTAALDGEPRGSIGTFPAVNLPGDPSLAPVQTGFAIELWSPDGATKPGGWAKRLTKAGVYPLRIRLRDADNKTVLTVVTFLIRGPDSNDEVEPQPVFLLADIRSATPAIELVDNPETPVDEDTLVSVKALSDALRRHRDLPAGLAVSPELVRRLEATIDRPPDTEEASTTSTTTSSSTVTSEAASTTIPGDDVEPSGAPEVLASLSGALHPEGRELLSAPAQTIDPSELNTLGLTDELTRQYRIGQQILADALEQPIEEAAWIRTHLDRPTATSLARVGINGLVMSPDAVIGSQPVTASPISGIGGDSLVAVADSSLRVGGHSDPVLAANRLVARLAAGASIDGPASPVVPIDLPRTDHDHQELESVFTSIEDNPFIDPRPLSELFSPTGVIGQPVELAPPTAVTDAERVWAGDLVRARSLLGSYASMVLDHTELVESRADRLDRSSDHRLDSSTRTAEVAAVLGDIQTMFDTVSIPTSDRVTLGARDAQFPLIITSTAEVPARVVVELSTTDRLTIAEPRIEVVLTDEHTEIPVHLRSRVPGDTPLRVRVTTPDGAVLLSEGTYSVRSTAVSGVGLVLTVGAGMFLAVWWGRHIWRNRRPRGRHAR